MGEQNDGKEQPMSANERAQLLERLAMLRAQQQQTQQQTQQQVPEEEMDIAWYEEAHSEDSEEEMICRQMEGPYVDPCRNVVVEDAMEIVATDKSKPRHFIGDFELLRLAKMGDYLSFTEFAHMSQISPATFADNKERNSWHYAADSGSMTMLEGLRIARIPYVADERGLTPLQVAQINQAPEDVLKLLKEVGGADASEESYAALVARFAPHPPAFVMSKAEPSPPEATGARSFWAKSSETGTPDGLEIGELATTDDAEAVAQELQSMSSDVGFASWLRVIRPEYVMGCTGVLARMKDARVGALMAKPLTGVLRGSGKQKDVGDLKGCAIAANLCVAHQARKKGVAAALMRAMSAQLKSATSTKVVLFASHHPIPNPPPMLSMVKWFRKAVGAQALFAEDYSTDIFPEFYDSDQLLRADCILKGSVAPVADKYEEALRQWTTLAADDVDAVKEPLYTWVESHATSTQSGVDLAYVPADAEELKSLWLGDGHLVLLRKEEGSEAITDLVVLERCASTVAARPPTVFRLIYALFTFTKGPEKVLLTSLMAQKAGALVVFFPTMFGLTDSDLVKANCDEVLPCRQYMYALEDSLKPTMPHGLTRTTASRLALPAHLF